LETGIVAVIGSLYKPTYRGISKSFSSKKFRTIISCFGTFKKTFLMKNINNK